MKKSDIDAGTIAALMLRFEEYRLPRAKRLLEKVNGGDVLSDEDIQFLKRVYRDSRANEQLVQRNPGYLGLVSSFISLYSEIITKGLENEKTR